MSNMLKKQVSTIKKAVKKIGEAYTVGEVVAAWEDGDLDLDGLNSDLFLATVYAIGYVSGYASTAGHTVDEMLSEEGL